MSKPLRGCRGADVPLACDGREVDVLAAAALEGWEADRPLAEPLKEAWRDPLPCDSPDAASGWSC